MPIRRASGTPETVPVANPDQPAVSLIICTRNRAAGLVVCLQHVRRLLSPAGGWELVTVDNGSVDDTPRVLEEFAREAPFPVIRVHAARPGLARARNAGIARARGAVYVFTDDDCYVAPDFLVQMCRAFEESQAGYVGGRITLHDSSDDPVTTRDVARPEAIPPYGVLRPGLIHGANMAVRRDVVEKVGGFDPILGAGMLLRAGEDADLLARASSAGWLGVYDPRPVVAHHHGRKPGPGIARLMRGYDYGRGAYYAKALLDHTRRRPYLRLWASTVRDRLCQGNVTTPAREVAGALFYLGYRVTRSRRPRE
jgi:glycosyltransferase involved in cell wall biosynthesis